MNKRGISAVVVTILIILIAIIAVSILWAALRPTIESGAEQAETTLSCSYLNLNMDSASYDDVTEELTVKVSRDAGEADLSQVNIYADGSLISGETDAPLEHETKIYTISVTEEPSEIKIAGVVGDQTCSVADSTTNIA
jgi:archaellum component FlaF (FlaF/FlaG flagellin family)